MCDPPTPKLPAEKTRVREVGAEGRLIQSGSSGNDVFFYNNKKKCTFNGQKEESLGKWRRKLLWVPHVFFFWGDWKDN